MIVSRAPVRISLGGGGTDLESYYSKRGGFLIAGAINRHVYVCLNRRFFPSIRLAYSITEIVDRVSDIQHPVFRACLEKLGVENHVELASISDIPANCGLGTSSTFTVALLNALHAFRREYIPLGDLAEEACDIEINRLGEPIGKQDQYMAAFGGVTCLTFDTDGTVHAEPLVIKASKLLELEQNILLFYTGIERRAGDILSEQNAKTKTDDVKTVDTLDAIKQIGLDTKRAFESGNLDAFGEMLDVHWQTKKRLSSKVSSPFIDECYETAMKTGALGGKIMGAGGGGFFMFYAPRDQDRLTNALEEHGLTRMYFRFDHDGARIVSNMTTSEFLGAMP